MFPTVPTSHTRDGPGNNDIANRMLRIFIARPCMDCDAQMVGQEHDTNK